MQFFKHMSNMRHDPRIKKLTRKYKAEGYAVYVWILESITEGINTDSPLPVLEDETEDLSYDLGIPESKIEEIVKYCSEKGLLQVVSDTGVIYCVKIYKFLNTSQTRSDRLRQMITTISGATAGQMEYNQIKNGIEEAILLHSKELPLLLEKPENVCDNNDRKDIEKNKNRIDKEENKSKKTSSLFEEHKIKLAKEEKDKNGWGNFQPSKPVPEKPELKPDRPINNIAEEIRLYWNGKENLKPDPFPLLNNPNCYDIATSIDVLGKDEIKAAIDNFDRFYHKEDNKPETFIRFMEQKKIVRWLNSSKPWERYDDNKPGMSQAEIDLEKYSKIQEEFKVSFDPDSDIMKQANAKVEALKKLVEKGKRNE